MSASHQTDNMVTQSTFLFTAYLMLFTFITTNPIRAFHNKKPMSVLQSSFPIDKPNSDSFYTFSFCMHDIQGGSSPTAQAITGIGNKKAVSSQIPFAKPKSSFVNLNDEIPFLTINNAFGSKTYSISTLRELMFGTITVMDNELTNGRDLGSGSVGKAQGFYIAVSEDGHNHFIAFTAMFESGGYADSISFFGVYRTVVLESYITIIGGTGKYANAKGYAVLAAFPSRDDQLTRGIEALLELTVYAACY